MQWTELKLDIVFGDLANILRGMDCASAIRLHLNLRRGTRIYVLRDCATTVMNHVGSDDKEVGGLLLGRVWESNHKGLCLPMPLVLIVESIASEVYRNSSISLEMGTEIWNRVNDRVSRHLIVVGWYHSHPNIGAFFSGTDRRTQSAFFNHSYSIGWVIDPFRLQEKVFVGKEAEEYLYGLTVVNHDLEMAKGN